jgi:predicted NBD/HSP70 family sugar kinase
MPKVTPNLRSNDPRVPVLNAVLATGERDTTRKELAEIAGVSPRSVMKVIADLSELHVLERDPVRLGPGCGLVLSFALGSESLRGGLLDANGNLHCQKKLPAMVGQLGLPPDRLLERVRKLANEIMAAGLHHDCLQVDGALRMLGVNVAWPSPIDRRGYPRGRVLSHHDWHGPRPGEPERLSLKEHVALALGPPFSERKEHVSAINDANADALAVAFDHARGRALDLDDEDAPRVILTVRIGGGLGAATIELATHKRSELSFISARLMVGTNGYAGELGHLPISKSTVQDITADPPEGLAAIGYRRWGCSCGGHGHLESLASGTAFARRMQASGYEVMGDVARATSQTRVLMNDRGNAQAQRALQDCGRLIGRALANAILMHDPHSVWLTGFFADEQVVRGIEQERGIWGSMIGDTVTIKHLTGENYAYNAVKGAGLAVVRQRVMSQLAELLTHDRLKRLTFPFDHTHLHTMHRDGHSR